MGSESEYVGQEVEVGKGVSGKRGHWRQDLESIYDNSDEKTVKD